MDEKEYEETHILHELKALNIALKMYLSRRVLPGYQTSIPSELQRSIFSEVEKFYHQNIVLLPPEESKLYCSQCGRKL